MFCFLYHEILPAGESSGFRLPGYRKYIVPPELFRAQLQVLESYLQQAGYPKENIRFTFDDGGTSDLRWAAPLLEEFGWRGHFFIPTAFIGQPGFMCADDLCELGRRGHSLGSHAHRHLPRMNRWPMPELEAEWRQSREILEDLTGSPITAAAVPGGWYGPRVAEAAALAGIKEIYTSAPTIHSQQVSNCMVQGRFNIGAFSSAGTLAALISNYPRSAWGRQLRWQLAEIYKRMPKP